jgi:hypothetical protein
MSRKAPVKGTKTLPKGISCYSRYNNYGSVYTICGDPYKAGTAKIKKPPKGPFSAYFKGEASKGPVERYYMAPQIDPSDFLLSLGQNYRDLTPAQQNEYQRLDKAMRRSKQFQAISSGTGGKEAFTEYMKADRKEKIEEQALRDKEATLKAKKEKLRNKYDKKGVTVASTEKEITEYFDDRLKREIARVEDKDRQEATFNARLQQREQSVKQQIKDAQDDIINYAVSYNGGELWKVPYKKFSPNIQQFLTKSGLISNDIVKTNIFRNRDKPSTEQTTFYKKLLEHLTKTKDPDKQKEIIAKADQKTLRNRIETILPNTPFHAEDKVRKDQKENYNTIIEGAKEQYEKGALEQFKDNYPEYLADTLERTRKGELKRLTTKRDNSVARAKNELKVAKREALEKGKEYKWINKYVKLVFDVGSTIDNVEKANGQDIDIDVEQTNNLKELMTSSSKLIDEITDLQNEVDKIDDKKDKVESDYEKAIKKLKDKKKKATLLKKRKADLAELDKQRKAELKQQLKQEIQFAKMNKKHSEVAEEIKKEISNSSGKAEKQVNKVLKEIDKQISNAEKGVGGNIQMKITELQEVPPIPQNIKGKSKKKLQASLSEDEKKIKALEEKIAKKKEAKRQAKLKKAQIDLEKKGLKKDDKKDKK